MHREHIKHASEFNPESFVDRLGAALWVIVALACGVLVAWFIVSLVVSYCTGEAPQ